MSEFLFDFSDFLNVKLVFRSDKNNYSGAFNFNAKAKSKVSAAFNLLLDTFGFSQIVNEWQ